MVKNDPSSSKLDFVWTLKNRCVTNRIGFQQRQETRSILAIYCKLRVRHLSQASLTKFQTPTESFQS